MVMCGVLLQANLPWNLCLENTKVCNHTAYKAHWLVNANEKKNKKNKNMPVRTLASWHIVSPGESMPADAPSAFPFSWHTLWHSQGDLTARPQSCRWKSPTGRNTAGHTGARKHPGGKKQQTKGFRVILGINRVNRRANVLMKVRHRKLNMAKKERLE